jgi:hypothetical protein
MPWWSGGVNGLKCNGLTLPVHMLPVPVAARERRAAACGVEGGAVIVLFVMLPAAAILGAIRVRHDALTVPLVVLPFAVVHGAIAVCANALAMPLAVLPLAV